MIDRKERRPFSIAGELIDNTTGNAYLAEEAHQSFVPIMTSTSDRRKTLWQ